MIDELFADPPADPLEEPAELEPPHAASSQPAPPSAAALEPARLNAARLVSPTPETEPSLAR
ncbi:MAG: hypothetical protein ACRDMJ_14490 [Solirubrobacteraceae bacterium]